MLAGCGRAPDELRPGAAAESASAPRSVLFVGLDGADWQFLEPLMASGRMPNLARLEREGSGGVLATEQPPLSPLLWTTMMTGRSPLEHRILDFVRFNPSTGRREPITNDERRVPAVWNLASEAGREVAVVGLWATFPADETKGLLVSNVFLSARGSVAHALSPAREAPWAERVRQEATASVDIAAMRRLLPGLPADELAAAASSTDPFAEKVPGLRQVLVQTEIVRRLSRAWLSKHPTRLAAVYFEGTDTIGHLFAPFVAPVLAGVGSRGCCTIRRGSGALFRARRRGDRGARGGRCALGGGADDRVRSWVRMGRRASGRAFERRGSDGGEVASR